jgi:sulfur transfer protein SufE
MLQDLPDLKVVEFDARPFLAQLSKAERATKPRGNGLRAIVAEQMLKKCCRMLVAFK